MSASKVKYTVALPLEVSAQIERLSKAGVMSKPALLRRAIMLYSVAQEALESGRKLCVVDAEDKVVKEVVVL